MNKSKVVEFYDEYVKRQSSSGVNDRIYSLYQRMKNFGLNSHSNVLELGSGVGVMTYLLSKTVKKGHIEAVEISPKSVEFAQKKNRQQNIRIVNSDVVGYQPNLKSIDFITLFDVIEHIPKEKHLELFKNLSNHMSDKTRLLINIPNPDFIEYDIKHNPEVLQVIDQPIHLNFMAANLKSSHLNLRYFEKYSLWTKDDYIFYVIEKERAFEAVKIQDERSFAQKVFIKLLRLKLRWFYKYD